MEPLLAPENGCQALVSVEPIAFCGRPVALPYDRMCPEHKARTIYRTDIFGDPDPTDPSWHGGS